MQLKNIDHLNLTVADFDETVAWYRRVFGFERVEEDVQEGTRWDGKSKSPCGTTTPSRSTDP